jgi:hypothetical protein
MEGFSMGDGKRSRSERTNAVAILASFMVISAGLAGAIVVCTIAAPDPKYAIPAAIGVFLLIAVLPFNAMRERSRDPVKLRVKGPGVFRWLKDWFGGRKDEEKPEPKTWKRRRGPKSGEGPSIFVPEGAEQQPKAPFMG